jgi:hypothetical protein
MRNKNAKNKTIPGEAKRQFENFAENSGISPKYLVLTVSGG